MLWLKQEKPAAPPPPPKRVDINTLLLKLTADETSGAPSSPAIKYLADHKPIRPLDRWGSPLPLSDVEQERLDRIVAILFDTTRARKLLVSGRLDNVEREALQNGQPGIYEHLCMGARADMAQAGPPFPAWADAVLGILFGRDAALVYGAETQIAPVSRAQFNGKAPNPTPADLSGEPALKGR